MHDLTKTQVHLQLSLHPHPPPHDLEFARHGRAQTIRACAAWDLFFHLLPSHPFLFPTLFLSVPHYSFSLPKAFCECIFSMVNPQWRSVVLTPHWQSYKCHAVHFEDLVDTPCYICAL